MYQRSLLLLVSLALVSVFSSTALAETYTRFETDSPYITGYATGNYDTLVDAKIAFCKGYTGGVSSVSGGNVDCLNGARAYLLGTGTTKPTWDREPGYDTEDGSCIVGSWADECAEDADRDGDGIPNVIDKDSGIYDENYCYDNPDNQLCIDHDGGDTGWTPDDGSGGDDGSWNPDPSLECTTGYGATSQDCCTSYGQHYCAANNKGGLVDAAFTNVGGNSCSITCQDDVTEPPDNGGGDNGGGDNGGGTGGDNGGGSDGGSNDNPDDSGSFDDSNIVQAINNASDVNDDALNDVRSAIDNGFNQLDGRLVDFNNNMANGINGLGSELSNLNNTASGMSADLSQIEQNTSQTNDILNGISDSIGESPSLDNMEQSIGLGDPSSHGNKAINDLRTATGITGDERLDTRVIDLGEKVDDFEPMLGGSSTECPAPYTTDFFNRSWVIEWEPMCDAFSILRIFVIAAAWFACPFIILGVGKK